MGLSGWTWPGTQTMSMPTWTFTQYRWASILVEFEFCNRPSFFIINRCTQGTLLLNWPSPNSVPKRKTVFSQPARAWNFYLKTFWLTNLPAFCTVQGDLKHPLDGVVWRLCSLPSLLIGHLTNPFVELSLKSSRSKYHEFLKVDREQAGTHCETYW